MQTDVFKRAQENSTFVFKHCQKTNFSVAVEIETKPKPIDNHNGRAGF